MTQWHSLYLPSADTEAIVHALQSALIAPHYAPYDPFGLMPGCAYEQALKLFVSPPSAPNEQGMAWTRLVAAPDSPIAQMVAPLLSQIAPCLYIALNGDTAEFAAFRQGQYADLRAVFGIDPDDLQVRGGRSAQASGGIPLDALPEDVQRMAGKVNPKRAERLFNRMSKGVLGQGDREAARDLIHSTYTDWNSTGGQRILALLNSLDISSGTMPDYVTLRDAYQIRRRKQRRPDAMLLPGDADTMAAVPDALDYTPFFAGIITQTDS